MRIRTTRAILTSACVGVLLTACGGGDGEDNGGEISPTSKAHCESITGGASSLTATCDGCTISNQERAADGDLDTPAIATVELTAASATMIIRATAQDGVVFPAGSHPGVFFTGLRSSCDTCGTTIRTFLQGEEQESQPGFTNTDTTEAASEHVSFFEATMPFDAVEIEDAGVVTPGVEDTIYRVYEICSEASYDE